MTVGSGHGLTTGTNIKIASQSLSFTCAMDDHASVHQYPRHVDPIHNEPTPIVGVTNDTIVVNVGKTPEQQYDVNGATFTPADGKLVLTTDRKTTLRQSSTHSISTASYDGKKGLMRLKITDHGFSAGDYVKVADGGVSFTCSMDNNATVHAYPRSTDPMSDKWMDIRNVSKDEFDIFVGRTPEIPFLVTAAEFTPVTGHMKITIGDHNLRNGQSIRFAKESLTFTCFLDAHQSLHPYPRSSGSNFSGNGGADPFYNKPCPIIHDGSPLTATTGTSYNPTTGIMSVTTDAAHGLSNGDEVKFKEGAVTFQCLEDNNGSNHPYPRATDPYANRWLAVSNVSTYAFDVQVLSYAPSTNTTTHTFVQGTVG